MSIQPVLGHKTITSYFSPASSTKRKRKQIDNSGSSSTEGISKRPKECTRSSIPSTKLVNAKSLKVNVGEGPIAAQKANFSRSFTDEVVYPLIALGNPSVERSMPDTTTHPIACVVPFQKGSEKKPSSKPHSSCLSTCQQDEPARVSLPARPPPYKGYTDVACLQPSRTAASFLDVTSSTPDLTIPSSQSQDFMTVEDDMLPSLWKTSELSRLRPFERDDLIIESSQSQLLIMPSPNVRQVESEPTLPSLDVVIPSSQSQEKELTIPSEDDVDLEARSSSLIVCSQRGFKAPQRTLSEETFPVPIQRSILDEVFLDDQAPDSPTAGNNLEFKTSEHYGTAEEFEGVLNSCYNERSMEALSWTAARASSISQSSLGIGSYSSLPPEVWEFRRMFENGDESYPADFPESLRS